MRRNRCVTAFIFLDIFREHKHVHEHEHEAVYHTSKVKHPSARGLLPTELDMEGTEVSCAPDSSVIGRQYQHQIRASEERILEDQDHAAGDHSPLELASPDASGHSPCPRDGEEAEASRMYKRLMLEDTASATSLRMGLSKQSRAAQVRFQQ